MGEQTRDEERVQTESEARESKMVSDLVDDVVSAIADLDGIRVLEYKGDGVYLTVFAPMGAGKPIQIEQIMEELAQQGITEILQEEAAAAVAQMTGQPVKVAASVPREPMPGQVFCRVSQDEMEAYARVVQPKHGGKPITAEQVLAELSKLGVVWGIDEEKIERAVALADTSEEVLVAAGEPMLPGENAQLEYKFKLAGMSIQPKELEDGRVDFYNLDLIQNVLNGQVLVTKKPCTSGSEGTTVKGKKIPTKAGKDLTIKAGKNTELIDNNTTLIATANGHVVNLGGKVSVLPVYEVPGDVNLSTGNVDFVGNVVVKGNIGEGFLVKAQGDVEVRGSISGGSVQCEGHLQVKNGIQGVGKGIIRCGGNVFTKFIENATVCADGDIVVGEAVMHSNISAKGSIMVGGRKGVIVGGLARAGSEITAKIVGSNLSTVTELEAGVNPELRERYNKEVKELEDTRVNLDKTQKAFILLKNMEQTYGELEPDKKAMLVKVSRAQYQMMAMVKSLEEQVTALQEELEVNTRGKISISNLVHPGVKITIGTAIYYVGDPIQFSSFIKEHGEVRVVALK
ncbi:MAG TPA: FapA family protein [Bacillota bacterium]|nr:FapA family protein [Bacillota bacterium]